MAKCGDGWEQAAIQGFKSGNAALAAAAGAGFIADAKDVSGNNVPVTGGKFNGAANSMVMPRRSLRRYSWRIRPRRLAAAPAATPGTTGGGQTQTTPTSAPHRQGIARVTTEPGEQQPTGARINKQRIEQQRFMFDGWQVDGVRPSPPPQLQAWVAPHVVVEDRRGFQHQSVSSGCWNPEWPAVN